MATLRMTDPSGREQDYEIDSRPRVFGRGEDSDVVLGSRSVARHHMRVWDQDGAVMVEDLTGGRGLKIDGEEVTGTFELHPGSDMQAGVFVFSVPGKFQTDFDAEPMEKRERPPVLAGTKGPTKGLEIELQQGDNDVGRDPELYLVIDDPSVSRLHARISVGAEGITLVDMRSSNGTFVNSKRIESRTIESGDLVRFGNLEFRLVHGEGVSKGATALKRKRLLLVGAGTLVGIFLIIVIAARSCQEPPPKRAVAIEDRVPIEVQVEQHLKAARRAMEDYDWKMAGQEVDKALDLHPISTEARKLRKKIEKELVNKDIYDEGKNLYDLSKWADALGYFMKIPEESAYHKKVKYKISEIENKLTDYHFSEGKSYYKAQQYRKAHKHFVEYMELKPCDRKVYQKWIKKTEAKMRRFRIKHEPFTYNCTEKEQPSEVVEKLDPEEVLQAAYPDKKIYRAMFLYFKGKADVALQAIRRIKVLSDNPRLVEMAKDLERQIMIVDGKYNEGTSSLYRAKLKDARENFRIALAADEKIMPKGVRSHYREDIQAQLTAKLYKLGFEEYNRKHWEESFKHYLECVQVNPDETHCQRGLNDLEERGEEAHNAASMFLERGQPRRAVDLWKLIMKFTRPESLPYKKAVLKLKDFQERQ